MCRRVRFPPASAKIIFRSSIFFFPPSFEVFFFLYRCQWLQVRYPICCRNRDNRAISKGNLTIYSTRLLRSSRAKHALTTTRRLLHHKVFRQRHQVRFAVVVPHHVHHWIDARRPRKLVLISMTRGWKQEWKLNESEGEKTMIGSMIAIIWCN